MKTYVMTIRYKELYDNEWQYKNKILTAKNVKEAIAELYKKFKNYNKFYIDSIYSEETNG